MAAIKKERKVKKADGMNSMEESVEAGNSSYF